jgi:thiol:disulfide interchange protein
VLIRRISVHRGALSIAAIAGAFGAACAASAPPARRDPIAVAPPEAIESPAESAIDLASDAKPKAPLQPIHWETSELDARARAKAAHLPLIVYLRADWSAASLRQERAIWTDARVLEATRRFVLLRIDLSDVEGGGDAYLAKYGVLVVPTTIVYDSEGRRIASLEGEVDAAPLVQALATID